ncbi:hypothetical protein GCM10023178_13860 [Actinomadura luteofluorescens]
MSSGHGTPAATIASRTIARAPLPGITQQVTASRPPSRSTPRSRASATSGEPTWLMTKLPATASNVPSSNGTSGRTATFTSSPGTFRSAVSAMPGSASMADTSAPRRAASRETNPGPVPTSSSRVPSATPAASSSGSIMYRVTWANPRSYAGARPAHSSRS